MNVNFIKKASIMLAPVVAMSTVSAAMDTDARLSELESQMKQVRTETAVGTYGANTATARPEVNGNGWFLTADLLYWKAQVGGTEFAYTDQDPFATLPTSGRVKDNDFSWDWGLRAGIGYNFLHDGWDAMLRFTYFNSGGSSSTSGGLNSSVIPLKGHSDITLGDGNFEYCNSAKSQFDFDYKILDLDLGRHYFVSRNLSFHPFIGLKTAWIDLEQDVTYSGGQENTGDLGLGVNNVSVDDESDFWGLGPHTGVNTSWFLGNGFSVFGNLAGALLYGNFDVDHKEKYSAIQNNRVSLSANTHRFSPTVQFQLGLSYQTYIYNDKQHFYVGLGYENNYWWRQNQFIKVDGGDSRRYERVSEDIAMHGITFDIKWDF